MGNGGYKKWKLYVKSQQQNIVANLLMYHTYYIIIISTSKLKNPFQTCNFCWKAAKLFAEKHRQLKTFPLILFCFKINVDTIIVIDL